MNVSKLILIFLFLPIGLLPAQSDSSKQVRFFQLSILPPLSTNGMENSQLVNQFSINLIAGYSGGVQGVEIGGFANVNKGSVRGYQGAGFANVVSDTVSGLQTSGFANVAKEVIGGQLAGFGNVGSGSAKGTQLAGFVNVVGNSSAGLQAAGFTNITAGHHQGVQMSGFLNYARTVKGIQLGFINISDSIDGAAIGFFSYVKHGYRGLELSSNETFHTVLSFKTGTSRFYNIFSAGARWTKDEPIWTAGYGIGTHFSLAPKLNLNADAISYFLFDDLRGINDWSSLNKLHLAVSYELTPRLSLFAGPTFTVAVQDNAQEPRSVIPWETYRKVYSNATVIMYPGFNLGLRFLSASS